jgi:hypothetical protein
MASLKIWELMHAPAFRLADNPGNIALAEHLMVNPHDPYLRELFDKVLEEQLTKFTTSGDPFWGNYPPKGALRLPRDNTILIGFMPTGEAFGIPIFEREGHVGIAGPTRQAKTNLLRIIIVQAVLKGCCVVAMTHKPNELPGLMTLPVLRGICRVLRWTELILALLEPPPGVPRLVWAVQVVDLIARCFGLLASRRLLLGSASNLYLKNAIEDLNLDRWARYLRGFETGRGLREEGYKESAWWVLETLHLSTGAEQSIFRYLRSNFLQRLFSQPGLTVIEGTGLPSEIFAFIVVYICRWLYLWRLFGGPRTPAVKLAIDDATSEVADTWRMSTVAGTSLLDELFTQMLAVAMEFYFCIHRFGSESELSRANTSSYLFCSARENLRAIREFAGLTEEQSDKVRVLQPGEPIAFVPAFWPKPVYLRVPHVNPRLPTEQERETARDDFLSGVTAVAPGETRAGGGRHEKSEKRQEQAQHDSGEGGRRSWARTAMKLLGFGGRAKATEDLPEEERRVSSLLRASWALEF